jgi:nitroreductase
MAAPSSRDRRPWQFIVVSDKTVLSDLGGKLKTASALTKANRAIIVCGDTLLSDNCWFLDCSAATQNILLAAESMGIGAVWLAVYPYADREAIVNEYFQLPGNIRALAIVSLGYPAGNHSPKNKFDRMRIHHNKW